MTGMTKKNRVNRDRIEKISPQESEQLRSENLKFLENLSHKEIEQLWGDNLEQSIAEDLKAIEAQINFLKQFY